jgi:ribonuclease HII
VICGIDEAGRGPVLGPMVVAGVKVEDDILLREIGVKDSKKLTPKRREKLAEEIKKIADYEIQIVPAEEIDVLREEMTLNVLEAKLFATIIEKLTLCSNMRSSTPNSIAKDLVIYVDAADVNEENFKRYILSELGREMNIVSEHNADERYPVVSAASILAKTTRDEEIKKIGEEIGKQIGSGYPSDPVTINFLKEWMKEHGELPPYTRRSWKTARRIVQLYKTSKIEEF